MKSLIKSMFTAILILICIQNRAQDNDTLYIRRNEAGTIEYARFRVNESSDRKMENDTVIPEKTVENNLLVKIWNTYISEPDIRAP
jgi:hypothetical protein